MSLYFERHRFGGERYPWGSGHAQTGEWWWLKEISTPAAWDPAGVVGIVAYSGNIHVDNGYGIDGWIPVSGALRLPAKDLVDLLANTKETTVEVISDLVLAHANEEVDEMIREGTIENYLPGYLGSENGWSDVQPYRNSQPRWNIERHRWE